MQVECVHCSKRYSLRDENAGTQFKCRSCGKISPIAPATPSEATPAAEASGAPTAALVETQCLHCGKQYKLRPQAAGMQFKCKQCGQFSPVGASSQPPKESIPQAQPPIARVVQPAKPRSTTSVEPLVAIPIGPPAAVPVRPPAAIRAEPAAAPLAAIPLEPLLSGPSDMLDLLNEAQSPSMASPYAQPLVVGPQVAPALPPKAVGRKKRKRKSAASDQPSAPLRILGGVAMMAVGLAFAGFAAHAMQRPGRVIVLGVCVAVAGFKLMLGLNSDD